MGETDSLEVFELELKAGNSRKIDLSLTRKKGVSVRKTMVLVKLLQQQILKHCISLCSVRCAGRAGGGDREEAGKETWASGEL